MVCLLAAPRMQLGAIASDDDDNDDDDDDDDDDDNVSVNHWLSYLWHNISQLSLVSSKLINFSSFHVTNSDDDSINDGDDDDDNNNVSNNNKEQQQQHRYHQRHHCNIDDNSVMKFS